MVTETNNLFVSRPQRVEAIQWTGDNVNEVLHFSQDKTYFDRTRHQMFLLAGKDGAQEWVPVPVGHWIVHPPGDLSDIWPVDNEYFTAKYDKYEQENSDA